MANILGKPLRAVALLGLCVSALALVVAVGSASARSLLTHTASSSFNGSETEAPGVFEVNDMAVDEANGTVYVTNDNARVYKFSANGTPASFSYPPLAGATSFVQPFKSQGFGGFVAVDNNIGSPTEGRFYVLDRYEEITQFGEAVLHAYERSGKEVTTGNWPVTTMQDFSPSQGQPGDVAVDADGDIWMVEEAGQGLNHFIEFSPEGVQLQRPLTQYGPSFAIDGDNNFYVSGEGGGSKYDPSGNFLFEVGFLGDVETDQTTNEYYGSGSNATSDKSTVYRFDGDGTRTEKLNLSNPGFSSYQVAVNGATDRLYAGAGNNVFVFDPDTTVTIPAAVTDQASNFEATAVKVHGTVNPDGVNTTACTFEWGPLPFRPNKTTTCDQGNVLSGSGAQQVTATLTGLNQGETYSYRLVAKNAQGEEVGRTMSFIPSAQPTAKNLYVFDVHSDNARVHAEVDAGGAPTSYHVEYGLADCGSNPCQSGKEVSIGAGIGSIPTSVKLEGLQDGTTYHYRIVVTNQSGTFTSSADNIFTTFPYVVVDDNCPNAHVRQQTSAALLFDCRAYELVSAGNAGGYDVESDLSPGQEPLSGHPEADDRALYAIHAGAIPGVGDPANLGPDPYLATRGAGVWSTEYVGMPSENQYATGPFASTLLEADSSLSAFAFGGPDVCAPCFPDGSTNVPVRTPAGDLIQGMVGSEGDAAEPSGYIGRRFSAGGTHFVFGTETKLEPDANSSGTDTTIYDRNLETGVTQVVSTLPNGDTIENGSGVAELDISDDGTRIVVGELVSTDAQGNDYYRLYMHVGNNPNSIDLTPGTTTGVLFDGMSSDGTEVYFTTKDPLVTAADQDTDASADIFRAEVGSSSATLSRVSTGAGAGNSNACQPPGGWNSVAGGENCDVVAIAGGAGVATDSGVIYFVSPEKLDLSGSTEPEQDQPNLYAAAPGDAPRFVATVDTSVGKPPPPPPVHKVVDPEFVDLPEYSAPSTLAVDQNTGELYVGFSEGNEISRWKPDGTPSNFSSLGTNVVNGDGFGYAEGQVAVDSSSSPFESSLYVANGRVQVFNHAGEEIGAITGIGSACGVAVDQSNGDVYVGSYENTIRRFRPKNTLITPVTNASYEPVEGIQTPSGSEACNIDVSAEGHLYSWPLYGGLIRQFDTNTLTAAPFPSAGGTSFAGGIEGVNVQTDPDTGFAYVNEEFGSYISVYDSAGNKLETFGSGVISFTKGVGVDTKNDRIYVSEIYSEVSGIVRFDAFPVPYEVIENPLVRHGVTQSEVRDYEDFQTTPSGRFAAFPTKMPLEASFNNGGHTEVYRYDDSGRELVCVSCNPTNALAIGDASLAAKGLSLVDDGTIFFNTTDAIAPRDLNGKKDAYEYGKAPDGDEELQLISTGVSPFDSSLLGASSDGKDAFFFTRDTLVPQDENGSLVKLYDARAGGGFEFVPAAIPCKASDECHGPGTEPAPSPGISTLKGSSGNHAGPKAKTCKGKRVRRNGRCVKPRKHKKASKRASKTGHRRG
jgi:hypothetical protein